MQTSQLFCDADRMAGFWGGMWIKWDLSDKLQPSVSTYNLYPPRFPLLVALQVLIEVFTNGNPHFSKRIFLKSSTRFTE